MSIPATYIKRFLPALPFQGGLNGCAQGSHGPGILRDPEGDSGQLFERLDQAAIQGSAADDLVEQIVNTTEGFSIVLCDLKTFIESGKSANLVRAKAELISASMVAR